MKKTQKSKEKNTNRQYMPVKLYIPSRHPHAIVDQVGNVYISVGMTHAPKSGHHKLTPIKDENGERAYLRHGPTIDKKYRYTKTRKPVRLTKEAEEKARKIAKKANLSKLKAKKKLPSKQSTKKTRKR